MKTYYFTEDKSMSVDEETPITVNVIDLQTGEDVADAVIAHIPPDDSTPIDFDFTVDTPYINFILGPLAVQGRHIVDVQAVGSSAPPSKPVVRYIIDVK
jgi:hypothetical protein